MKRKPKAVVVEDVTPGNVVHHCSTCHRPQADAREFDFVAKDLLLRLASIKVEGVTTPEEARTVIENTLPNRASCITGFEPTCEPRITFYFEGTGETVVRAGELRVKDA